MNVLKTIRNNWKKSVFAFAASSYGIYSLYNHIEISSHMRHICNEIIKNTHTGEAPKRVVVILNPVANKKKAEKMFKKYCEPILHLGGFSVEILKTTYPGHAEIIVENMEKLPSALVIAGGDGTTSEAVTGLLQRKGQPCPVVLLPLGRNNTTVWEYMQSFPTRKLEHLKALPEAVLPLLTEKFCFKSVLKYDIDISDEETSETKTKTVFGLNRFSWGVLKDIESVKDRYWLFGNMRHHAAALMNSFSNDLKWQFNTDVMYTPPCSGCRNCTTEKESDVQKSYISKLLSTKTKPNPHSFITNDDCKTKLQSHVVANQIDIACKYNSHAFPELQTMSINSLSPGFPFIKELLNVTSKNIPPSTILSSRTIQLTPSEINEKSRYYIDGEEYNVRPIKITLIPNAIKLCM